MRFIPFAQITSAELRAGWIGGQVRLTVQDAHDTRGRSTPHVEEIVFVFQEERLKPLAKLAVEILWARAKKAQQSARTDVPESTSRLF